MFFLFFSSSLVILTRLFCSLSCQSSNSSDSAALTNTQRHFYHSYPLVPFLTVPSLQMKWLYIVGIILSVAYVGIFWYDIIMDSHLNDLLEILVLFMYVLLAVRFHRFLQFRFSSVCTSEISDILLFIFPHLVVSLAFLHI